MTDRMGPRKGFSQRNIDDVPDQSGVYNLIDRNGSISYVGMAGAGRLRGRLMEHLRLGDIPGVVAFQVRPASGSTKASKIEKELIQRHQPRHNRQGL